MENIVKSIHIDLNETDEQLHLTINDVKGSYQIPYIQSAKNIQFQLSGLQIATQKIKIDLIGKKRISKMFVLNDEMIFEDLTADDYAVVISQLDLNELLLHCQTCKSLGVGRIIAAIGDSITEGYHSHAFYRENLQLSASDFPIETVSADGRNFPQYSPTTHINNPEVNCLESWMTDLNNALSKQWQQPLFIANEGWGGISSAGYLKMMQNDSNWQGRIKHLAPSYWLIHLGVNDERAGVDAAVFFQNMRSIVNILLNEYCAMPEKIFIAKPSYDYATGAADILQRYCREIDQLIKDYNLQPGPDFFRAFSTDKAKLYEDDPVHPNVVGMKYMAELWAKKLRSSENDR
ncbi:MAG: SGNH/GDSL hydrolase family protein [Victivallaceae bacterium]|nr:SGNH/GDSL hydrolase family protein [Victivallaceae bacterium]